MLSRLTAEAPLAEPDSKIIRAFIAQMMKIIMGLQMKWIMEVMLLKFYGYLIFITVFPLP